MAVTSAAKFAAMTEMVMSLADEDQSRNQLARLRFVGKLFGDVFNPPCSEIPTGAVTIGDLSFILGCPHLQHIKQISLSGMNGEDGEDLLRAALLEMPHLESFKWNNGLLVTKTLLTLHGVCQHIEVLHIKFPLNMEQKLGLRHRGGWARSSDQENAHEVYRSLDLTLFHNLQELSLENICDDLDQRKLQIAHVLEHSPNMRRLRLSLSLEKRQRGSPPGGVHRQFFDGICDIYQATGVSTLRLRGLYFGGTTFPPKLGKLAKIADIAFLGEPSFWSAGLFAEFKKARCPNLRYVKVLDYDLDAFPSLFDVINPSQPQQLGTTMWHGSRGLRDGWLPRPSSSSPTLRVLPLVQGLNPLHVRDALHLKLGLDLRHMHDRGIGGDGLLGDIASTDKDTIEGLKVWVHLQKSFVSWHRKTYFALLKNVIPGLAILSQTHIKDKACVAGGRKQWL